MNGVLIVDKPQGFTSFDVAAIVRKLCKTKKVGHTGTLDPMATGVLPILIGNAAKAQQFMPDHSKEYIAELCFGIETDTLDITGNVLTKRRTSVTAEDMQNILSSFVGDLMQIPPMYSAIKKDGKRMYELAREGIVLELDPRPITVHELDMTDFNEQEQKATIRVLCSQGTYIRSICRDIGAMLGCGAVMSQLRRTRACGFSENQAYSLDRLREEGFNIEDCIMPTESLFSSYGTVKVSSAQTARFKNGGSLALDRLHSLNSAGDGAIMRVYSSNNEFIGLGKITQTENSLKFLKLFCNNTD